MGMVLSDHPKLLFFFHHFTHWTHTYRVNSSRHQYSGISPLGISWIHPLVSISRSPFQSGHLLLATAGISSLISPHPNVLSHHAATPSVHTAGEKLSCSSVWFLMMCFLVMWGWRAQCLVLQRLLQDRSLLSPSSVLNGLRLPCLLGLLSLRRRHCPSLPQPLRSSLPGTHFLILSSDLAQWLLLQRNPWIFFAKVFVLIWFQFSQLYTLSTTHCDSHPGYILTLADLAVIIWLVCVSPTEL